MVVEEVVRGEGPRGGQDIERGGLTPDMFSMEWVVGRYDAHEAREEAREEGQENLGALQVDCKSTRPDQLEVRGSLGCRSSSQEEGQEEGDWMKDSDSRDS
jgi:hypothetical protein